MWHSASRMSQAGFHTHLSYNAFQQRDFAFGQIKQVVDDAVDLGFGLGYLGGQAGDLGAVAVDPVFPVGTFGQGDVGFESLLHLGAESGEVGQCPPFLKTSSAWGHDQVGRDREAGGSEQFAGHSVPLRGFERFWRTWQGRLFEQASHLKWVNVPGIVISFENSRLLPLSFHRSMKSVSSAIHAR